MDTTIVTVVGTLGFLIILGATQLHRRSSILAVDAAGIVAVGAHWAMAGSMAGATLNGAYVVNDLLALGVGRSRVIRSAYWGFYPLVATIGLLSWRSPVDTLAVMGTLLSVVAMQRMDLRSLRSIVLASALCWGAYGVMEHSLPQMVFSLAFVAGHVRSLWVERGKPAVA